MQIFSKKFFYIRLTILVLTIVVLCVVAAFYKTQAKLLVQAKNKSQILAYRLEVGNIEPSNDQNVALTVPILVYHGIVPVADRFSLTFQTFKDQMFTLKRAGYQTVSLYDLIEFKKGNKNLPEKSIVITFDDGRKDSFLKADPILEALDFKAVMFIAAADSITSLYGRNDRDYYIHEKEIEQMVKSGRWYIESHAIQEDRNGGQILVDNAGTLGNFLSNKKWLTDVSRLETDQEYEARVRHELADAKTEIAGVTGTVPIALSYPFGDYGQQTVNNPNASEVISKVVKDNYALAFQQIWPVDNNFDLNYKESDPYHLHRIEVGTSWPGAQLIQVLNRGEFKVLPYAEDFSPTSSWKKTWGNIEIASSTLHLKSASSTAGAFSFLDGTYGWTNYLYEVKAKWQKEDYLSLVARFQDSQNYTSCTFGNGYVAITETKGGVVTNLIKVKDENPGAHDDVAISVKNNVVKCFIGPYKKAEASTLSTELNHGGIGVRIWSDNSESDLIIDSLNVRSI